MDAHRPEIANEAQMRFVAAFKEMYPEKGMRGISAASLADRAGYSRSTFYRSFESVYDVLRIVEIEATPYTGMQYLLDHANTVCMDQITNAFLEFFEKKGKLARMLMRHENDNRYAERLHDCIMPVFRSQVERVYIMQPEEYDVLAEHVTSSKITLLRLWAQDTIPMGLGHMTQITDAVLEGGLWERVEDAAKAAAAGRPYERTPFSYFTQKYSWIANRPLMEDEW